LRDFAARSTRQEWRDFVHADAARRRKHAPRFIRMDVMRA
jgi:hypothetical protein